MTRRDYCLDCGELVPDDAPCCVECNESFCENCIKPYDTLSRLASYTIKDIDDIDQFINDIQSPEVKFFLKKTYPLDEYDYYGEVIDNYNSECSNIINLYINNSDELIPAIKKFVSNFYNLDDNFDFICKECYIKTKN